MVDSATQVDEDEELFDKLLDDLVEGALRRHQQEVLLKSFHKLLDKTGGSFEVKAEDLKDLEGGLSINFNPDKGTITVSTHTAEEARAVMESVGQEKH